MIPQSENDRYCREKAAQMHGEVWAHMDGLFDLWNRLLDSEGAAWEDLSETDRALLLLSVGYTVAVSNQIELDAQMRQFALQN